MSRFGRYELQDQIGSGAFGDVYYARRTDDATMWALKILDEQEPRAVAELKHEARTLWNLPIAGVLTPTEVDHVGERWFMAMELARGQTLRSVLAAGPLPPARVGEILAELAQILTRIHERGLLHLDLKPENVIIDDENRITLLDFGLARWDRRRPAGTLSAQLPSGLTWTYAAPELIWGGQPSTASDAYALGAIGLELLTGAPPNPALHEQPLAEVETLGSVGQVCAALLRRVPDTRWTLAQVAQTLGRRTPERAVRASDIVLGRELEFEALEQHRLATEHRGGAWLLLVSGPPGVGKTACIQQWFDSLGGRNVRGVRARCYELERGSYKGFDEIVRELSEHVELTPKVRAQVAVMFPELGAPEPLAGSRVSLREAFVEFVDACVEHEPHVIWLDDVQWLDLDGVALLDELLTSARSYLTIVASIRAEHVDGFLAKLGARAKADRVSSLNLEPLADSAANQLLIHHGVLDMQLRAALLEQAGGNPFVLGRLAQVAWASSEPGWDLDRTLSHQLGQLSPTQRSMVELVAVAGRALAEPVLLRALQGGHDSDPIPSLKVRSWLRSAPGPTASVALYHDLIRAHTLSNLSGDELHSCHTALLEALEQHGAPESELFEHALGIGAHDRAANLALAAGQHADTRAAFENAVEWFHRAHELGSSAWNAERDTDVLLATALDNAGRPSDAAQWYVRSLERIRDPEQRWILGLACAEAWMTSGVIEHGRDALDSLLSEHAVPRRRGPLRLVASIVIQLAALWHPKPRLGNRDIAALRRADLCWTLAKGLAYTEPAEALDYALRSLRAARQARDSRAQTRALAFLGGGVFFQVPGMTGIAERYMAIARILADASEAGELRASIELWQGVIEIGRGRWTEARVDLERALALLEGARKSRWDRVTASQFLIWLDWREGDLPAMIERALTEQRHADERGDRLTWVVFSHFVAFWQIAQDHADQALALAVQIRELWSPMGFNVQAFYTAQIEVEARLSLGDHVGARTAWAAVQPGFRRAGGEQAAVSRIDNAVLRARLALHEGGAAWHNEVRRVAASLGREQRADAIAHGAWLAAVDRGDHAGLVRASRQLEEAGCRLAGLALMLQLEASEEAAAAMRAHGVRSPRRWAETYYPLTVGGDVGPAAT